MPALSTARTVAPATQHRVEEIPEAVARALRFNNVPHVFHCLWLHGSTYVGVAGDSDNGWYEWFTLIDGEFTLSRSCYGSIPYALREGLNTVISEE